MSLSLIHTPQQDFYPETLAAAYIMHTSWLFRAVWAIISPFLDEKTRSKVKVLSKYVHAGVCGRMWAYVDVCAFVYIHTATD